MYMPNGLPANNIDRTMLLALWVKHLKSQGKEIIFAGMGNPTFPINHDIGSEEIKYWNDKQQQAAQARDALSEMHRVKDNDDAEASALRDKVAEIDCTVPYGHPQGQEASRDKIAGALNNWYGIKTAKAKDIILPVGGAAGLYAIFDFINEKKDPKGVIVTPVPFYGLYKGNKQQNRLHPIHVMKEPGYKLTAKALKESIAEAKRQNLPINAFLFNDPSNPLGTVTDRSEWEKIAAVLREFLAQEKDLPDDKKTPIILDEAYAEMGITKKPISLVTVAPDLAKHIIVMRSATKGLSAAGERMALVYSENEYFINECLTPGVNIYGHAPISAQVSFAAGLHGLNKSKLEEMALYYGPKLKLVNKRAREMGVNMPDESYVPEGTFYIVLDLSDLIGQPLNEKAKQAVGNKATIQTNEDICYHLLFENNIMIGPASYSGLDPKSGFVRVTCSGGEAQLNKIMDGIHAQIIKAREAKRIKLLDQLSKARATLTHAVGKFDNPTNATIMEGVEQQSYAVESLATQAYKLISAASTHIASRNSATLLAGSLRRLSSLSSVSSGSTDGTSSTGSSLSSSPQPESNLHIIAEKSINKIAGSLEPITTAKDLKKENVEIERILAESAALILELDPEKKSEQKKANQSATVIQAAVKAQAPKQRYKAFKEKKALLEEKLDLLNQAESQQYHSKQEKKAAVHKALEAVHAATELLHKEEVKVCGTKRSIITTQWQTTTSGTKKDSEPKPIKKLGYGLAH